ncbi:MAG: phenylacetate--CoA ligase family protein [Myxococcota bacterium]
MKSLLQLIVMFSIAIWARIRERYFSKERIKRIQRKKLLSLVRYAYKKSPMYRKLYENIDINNFDITSLPPVNKEYILKHLSESLTKRGISKDEIVLFAHDPDSVGKYFKDKYVLSTTSGTTGIIGYFLMSQWQWIVQKGVEFARLLKHRLSFHYVYKYTVKTKLRWAMIVASEGHYITYLLARLTPKQAFYLSDIRIFSITKPMNKMVQDLNEFKPHYVHSYPTFLEALAYEKLAGRLNIEVDFMSSGSEPFSETARATIKKAFGDVEIVETYGTTEAICLANQCRFGKLHINEDYVIIEAVDEENKPVPDGVTSKKVLITNLINKFQPLIRYELRDSVVIDHNYKCECGSPFAVIEVQGRSDDTFYLMTKEGHFRAFPPIPFEALFLKIKGLRQYQLIHEEQNHLIARYIAQDPKENERIEREIRERFNEFFSNTDVADNITITIEESGEITRPPTHQKVRQIFSKVKPPPNII